MVFISIMLEWCTVQTWVGDRARPRLCNGSLPASTRIYLSYRYTSSQRSIVLVLTCTLPWMTNLLLTRMLGLGLPGLIDPDLNKLGGLFAAWPSLCTMLLSTLLGLGDRELLLDPPLLFVATTLRTTPAGDRGTVLLLAAGPDLGLRAVEAEDMWVLQLVPPPIDGQDWILLRFDKKIEGHVRIVDFASRQLG